MLSFQRCFPCSTRAEWMLLEILSSSQTARRSAPVRTAILAFVLALLAMAGFGALGGLRGSFGRAAGDEGTYLAMAASVAFDGDLEFDARDASRLEAAADPGRQAVILQRSGGRISYSKPILHALLTAPFYRALGEPGLAVFNGAVLIAALLLAWASLARNGPPADAALTVVTFAAVSALPAYVAWDQSDTLLASLSLAGLALVLAAARPAAASPASRLGRFLERPEARRLGAAALGLLAFSPPPHAIVLLAAVSALLLTRHWRWAAEVSAIAALAFGLAAALTWGLTGAAIPYKTERASFTAETGYPDGTEGERAIAQFAAGRATHSLALKPAREPAVSSYATLYFIAGRHTGLLLYFPAVVALAGCAAAGVARRGDRVGASLLVAALAATVFYLVWLPRNYFGGEGFVGNRYFLAAYPLFLIAPERLPRRRWLLAVWGWGAVVLASALLSVATAGRLDATTQSHADRGVFRLFPYESIAPAIDGRRDRYWADEFVRFVDPYARVDAWSFHLESGREPAELMIANRRPQGPLRFAVRANVPAVDLLYSDWRGEQVFPLVSREPGVHGEVEVLPAPAWRRHPLWWRDSDGSVARLLRLSIRSPDGRPARAELAYLGRYEVPPGMFEREVLAIEAPTAAEAASVGTLRLQVRNASRHPWSSDAPLPVELSYRLVHAGGGPAIEGPRIRLPERVDPGQVLDATVPISWPAEPGTWNLTVDLILEGVAWFAERTGAPLSSVRVEVMEEADWRLRQAATTVSSPKGLQ